MNEADRDLCGVCAARLAGQQPVAWLALVLTATGLVALALGHGRPWWTGVVLLGLAERYAAARVLVDARLFGQLAQTGAEPPRLDTAMAALRMIAPEAAGRPLPLRVQGALGWARRHTILVAAQAVLAAIAVGAS